MTTKKICKHGVCWKKVKMSNKFDEKSIMNDKIEEESVRREMIDEDAVKKTVQRVSAHPQESIR